MIGSGVTVLGGNGTPGPGADPAMLRGILDAVFGKVCPPGFTPIPVRGGAGTVGLKEIVSGLSAFFSWPGAVAFPLATGVPFALVGGPWKRGIAVLLFGIGPTSKSMSARTFAGIRFAILYSLPSRPTRLTGELTGQTDTLLWRRRLNRHVETRHARKPASGLTRNTRL